MGFLAGQSGVSGQNFRLADPWTPVATEPSAAIQIGQTAVIAGRVMIEITLTDATFTVTGATGVGRGNVAICTLAAGSYASAGVAYDLTFTKTGSAIADDFDGDFALGTTADANSSLATTEVNILPSTAIPQAAAGVAAAAGNSAAVPHVVAGTVSSGSALTVYINFLVDDADVSGDDATVAVSGKIVLLLDVMPAGASLVA